MGDHHQHGRGLRAQAAAPTLSLLRMSAAERLLGAGAVLALLWGLVWAVIA